jgi:hypothetical protein
LPSVELGFGVHGASFLLPKTERTVPDDGYEFNESLIEDVFVDGVCNHALSEPVDMDDYLVDVETNSETFIQAKTVLYLTKTSRRFVHGADAVAIITHMAGKILKDGERIELMRDVRFRRPILTNLDVTVIESNDSSSPAQIDGRDVVLTGTFVTDEGRILRFYGVDDPESAVNPHVGEATPLEDYLNYKLQGGNPIDGYVFDIDLPSCDCGGESCGVDRFYEVMCRSEFMVSAFMDLVQRIVLTSCWDGVDVRCRLRIMASFENIVLPEDLKSFFEGVATGSGKTSFTVKQLKSERKVTKSGFLLTTLEFRFANQAKEIVSKVVVGIPTVDEVAAAFCQPRN